MVCYGSGLSFPGFGLGARFLVYRLRMEGHGHQGADVRGVRLAREGLRPAVPGAKDHHAPVGRRQGDEAKGLLPDRYIARKRPCGSSARQPLPDRSSNRFALDSLLTRRPGSPRSAGGAPYHTLFQPFIPADLLLLGQRFPGSYWGCLSLKVAFIPA